MAADDRIYDGFDSVIGQDAATHPSYLPPNYVSDSNNRQYRGGINKTRPPMIELDVVLAEGEDPEVLTIWQTGNFQGAYPYRATNFNTNDGVVVSIQGNILFLQIVNQRGYLSRLVSDNDPTLMHAWFVQAEDRLYIQNGYQNAIAWDGVNAAYRLNPLAGKMPIGTVMEYAHGRVFVSDKFNRIFASDIIFGSGLTDTSQTENFTETTYWAEGGAFQTPSNLGNLTGMKIMPAINVDDRGQGELVVLCETGAYSLNVSVPRLDWKDVQIQRIALIGRGNLSPWSVTSVNNEIIYRTGDGWSFFSNSQNDFARKFVYRKIDREVNKWVSKDTPWMRQFASSMFFDNRVICTVSPYTVSPGINDGTMGLHRPHRAMIVLDLDESTAASPDAQISFRWNGLWTGPRPTQFVKAYIRGEERAFIFSFDPDNKNRIYELKTGGVDDYGNGVSRKIKSYFTTRRFSFTDTKQTNKFYRKSLNGGDFWLSDIKEEITSHVEYRPDSYPCWNELMADRTTGCDYCEQNTCDFIYSQDRYKRWKFNTPKTDCQIGLNIPAKEGAEFQIKVTLEGSATVDRLRISADTRGNADVPFGDCNETIDCTPIDCCPDNDVDFYTIVE